MEISTKLAKEISDYIASLTPGDIANLDKAVAAAKANAARLVAQQPNGCVMGRWEDINGVAPNEMTSDDANP